MTKNLTGVFFETINVDHKIYNWVFGKNKFIVYCIYTTSLEDTEDKFPEYHIVNDIINSLEIFD